MDVDTGQIVASVSTSKEVDDGVLAGPSLDQVTGSLSAFTADGAYDQDGVYAAVAERHPEEAVIVPPRHTAVLGEMAAIAPTRDPHLPRIAESSRMACQKASGYNWRARWRRRSGDGSR